MHEFAILAEIQQSHLSAKECKKRAQDFQEEVDEYSVCNSIKRHQPKKPLMPRKVPNIPWKMVGTDIFEFESQNYLVTVGYYSGFF